MLIRYKCYDIYMSPATRYFNLLLLLGVVSWQSTSGSSAQFSSSSSSSNSTTNSSRGSSTTFGGTGFGGTTFGGSPIIGRPIGTQTSATPTYNGGSPGWGVGGLGGTSLGGGVGQFGYYNNPGLGYYSSAQLQQQNPSYPAPVSLGGNFYAFGGLNGRLGYWRAPSGYYYPWCPPVYVPGAVYPAGAPIYAMDQGGAAQVQPPVGLVINDMRLFIEDARSKKQLDQSNYENIFGTLNQITADAAAFSAKNGGLMNASDETKVRVALDLLAGEIARSLNP